MAFLSQMSRKTQHTRFEDKILRKLANEDKPQVLTPWVSIIGNIFFGNSYMSYVTLFLCSNRMVEKYSLNESYI